MAFPNEQEQEGRKHDIEEVRESCCGSLRANGPIEHPAQCDSINSIHNARVNGKADNPSAK